MTDYTRGNVSYDGERYFPALIGPEDWNGFAVPRFSFAVAQRIARAYVEDYPDLRARVRIQSDAFLFWNADNGPAEDPDSWEVFRRVEIDGEEYFGIGACSWTWTVVQ